MRCTILFCVLLVGSIAVGHDTQGDDRGRVLRELGQNLSSWKRWVVQTDGEDQKPNVVLSPTSEGLEAIEEDEPRPWYYMAPEEMLGDLGDAYGGTLDIKLMHRNFLGGRGAPSFISESADIIIRSVTHEVSYSRAVKPLSYQSSVRVGLHENEGWEIRPLPGGGGDVGGGGSGMREVLRNVRALMIRGGFYRDTEITVLHSFSVMGSSSAATSSATGADTRSAAAGAASRKGGGEKGKWIPAKDPVSGRTYYWNSITKQSRWTIPQEDQDSEAAGAPAASSSSAFSSSSSSSSRPGAQTVTQLLEARTKRHTWVGTEDTNSQRVGAEGVRGLAGDTLDAGADNFGARDVRLSSSKGDESEVAGQRDDMQRDGKDEERGDEGGSGLSERERVSVVERAAGEEMVQARVAMKESIIAITRTDLILVDRHCVLRADLRQVESVDLSAEGGEGGVGPGLVVVGMMRQQLAAENIKSSPKACRQFEQLLVRNAQHLREGRPPPASGPPRQARSGAALGREGELVRQLASMESVAVAHLCYSPGLAAVETRAALGVRTKSSAAGAARSGRDADAAPPVTGNEHMAGGGRGRGSGEAGHVREGSKGGSNDGGDGGSSRQDKRGAAHDDGHVHAEAQEVQRLHQRPKQQRQEEAKVVGVEEDVVEDSAGDRLWGRNRVNDADEEDSKRQPDWDDWDAPAQRVKASLYVPEDEKQQPTPPPRATAQPHVRAEERGPARSGEAGVSGGAGGMGVGGGSRGGLEQGGKGVAGDEGDVSEKSQSIDWDDWHSPKMRHKPSQTPETSSHEPHSAPDAHPLHSRQPPAQHPEHHDSFAASEASALPRMHAPRAHDGDAMYGHAHARRLPHHDQPLQHHHHQLHPEQPQGGHHHHYHHTRDHSSHGDTGTQMRDDPLLRLKRIINTPVQAEIGGIREALAFTGSELFFAGPFGDRREPLSVVGPLRGTPTGEMQLMLDGREPITLTLGEFSDQKLHGFLQKLDDAAKPHRPRALEHPSAHSSAPPHSHLNAPHVHPHTHHSSAHQVHGTRPSGAGVATAGDRDREGSARTMDEAVMGQAVIERVDGEGCSIALTREELVVVDAALGTRREQLPHVLGVRNSPSGDLEIQLAGGLPIPIAMGSMPPAAMSKLFAAMTPLTNSRMNARGATAAGAGGAESSSWPEQADRQARGASSAGNGLRVDVDPVDEEQWRIDPSAAAELKAQLEAKMEALGMPAMSKLVGSRNALALTELQLVLLGNATGFIPEGRQLMLARVRKIVRDDQGAHEVRMVEGFRFRIVAQGFAKSSRECVEALDDFMAAVAARVKGLKVPEQLVLEAEEDELEAAAAARARHEEAKEEERLKRLSDMQRRQAARKAMQGSATGGGHTGALPRVSPEATTLLQAAVGVVTAQIVAVLESGHEQLLALTVAEVVWSRPGALRREALSDIEKVVSSPEGNLLLKIKGREPLPVEASKFDMGELGAFFQFLSEFHSKAIEARLQEEEEARKERERRRKQEDEDLKKQGEAALEAAKLAKIAATDKLRAMVVGAEQRRLVKEVYGVKCIFAVSDEEALFADGQGLQVAALRHVVSVRNDPKSGALLLVIKDDEGERAGITVPVDAFNLEQLGEVFGAMGKFTEGLQRAARDEQARLDEERLAKEREIREAEEAKKRKLEEEEAARKAEELRLAAEAQANAAAEEKALKEKMENMPKVAAKKAKDPIVLQLKKEGMIMAVSRRTLYVVDANAEMKSTEIKKIEKVAMGADGGSMVVMVAGQPFVEIIVSDFPMDQLGAFFQKLTPS